ncbi:MAG: ribosome maturation factor RimP [Deltaproteobacteria bacterium]|nr:ribosome maturation factor RimP [Deltaproteobacteria bacterium]
MQANSLAVKIRTLIEATVERMGFELVAVEWLGGPQGGTLRVSIDGPEGVSAGDCADVTHHISPLLDEADPISGAYRLEVSSPGMERPLQRMADFQRFAGYRAKIRLVPGPPRRRYTGTLKGVEGDEVRIEVDGEEFSLMLEDIEQARLVLDLDEFAALSGAQVQEIDHDDQ